jgi:hypothetical protein
LAENRRPRRFARERRVSCLAGIVKQGAIHLCAGERRFGAPIDQEFGDDVTA